MNFQNPDSKPRLIAAALFVLTAAVNLVSAFFLPAVLPRLLAENVSETVPFLIVGALLVGASGAMAAFGPSKTRWLITQGLLTVMDFTVIAVNLFFPG